MTKQEHRVSVEGGKYTFVRREDGEIRILRHGEPWIDWVKGDNAIHAAMAELDAARGVVAAVRASIKQLEGKDVYPAWAVDALKLHDSLVDDREPPSAWCGGGTEVK